MGHFMLFICSTLISFKLCTVIRSHILLERIGYYLEIFYLIETGYIALQDNTGKAVTRDQLKKYMEIEYVY